MLFMFTLGGGEGVHEMFESLNVYIRWNCHPLLIVDVNSYQRFYECSCVYVCVCL
jgi:hypothetical protein